MFVLNEDESLAVPYNDIIFMRVKKEGEGYIVLSHTENVEVPIAKFDSKPKLGAIIASMWYANMRGMAKWKYNDPT